MRFILFFMIFSFMGLFLTMFIALFKPKKIIEKPKKSKSFFFSKKDISDPIQNLFTNKKIDNIDIYDSSSITQYGNSLLKEFGNISDFMFKLSNDTFASNALNDFNEIVNMQEKNIDEDCLDKFNFISHYTKNKIISQVKETQAKINQFESKLSDFDSFISYAEKVLLTTKISDSKKSIDTHKNMTLINNKETLKNKIITLKKNKIYYEQSIVQLKTIMNINNSTVVNFDELIYQVIPLMRNKKSLSSMNITGFDSFKTLLKDLERLQKASILKK